MWREHLDEQVRQQLTEELARLAFRCARDHDLDGAIADMGVVAQTAASGSTERADLYDTLGQWLGQ